MVIVGWRIGPVRSWVEVGTDLHHHHRIRTSLDTMWKLRAGILIVGISIAGCSSSDSQGTEAGGAEGQPGGSVPAEQTDQAQGLVDEPAAAGPVICGDTALTSTDGFDAQTGTYAAYVLGYVSGQPEFDVVQWLAGSDADDAYWEANPEAEFGAPGGVLIRNQNPRRRIAPVAADAASAVLASRDADELESSSPLGFERYVESRNGAPVFAWLTFDGGTIVSVCEQRLP